MKNTKLLKRFGVLIFSIGFALMMVGDVYHLFGGFLILISVWADLFTQEMIDDHFENDLNDPYHGNNRSLQETVSAT
ncbi:MAG: hypothetical protein PHY47_00680 [Lachnospiraceae bacterium]|nr:hypothetical protein [Lachnospiraceae bacterium]